MKSIDSYVQISSWLHKCNRGAFQPRLSRGFIAKKEIENEQWTNSRNMKSLFSLIPAAFQKLQSKSIV